MLRYLSPVRVVSRRIRGTISRQLQTPHTITEPPTCGTDGSCAIKHNTHSHHRASTSLNSRLVTCRVHGFLRLSPYPYTSISSIQSETKLVRPGNVFLVINSPMLVLTGPGEA
ncbi:uncharacterized protein TNCV_146741 [Trichonephila clavipes]|nr:uncharacterized protein TNCV_146741 [Trichonephila clavipes]